MKEHNYMYITATIPNPHRLHVHVLHDNMTNLWCTVAIILVRENLEICINYCIRVVEDLPPEWRIVLRQRIVECLLL